MHRETGAAIVIGLLLGLITTFSLYFFINQKNESPPSGNLANQLAHESVAENPDLQPISLRSPEVGLVTPEAEIEVAGTTLAQALVVIFINQTETIMKTDENGAFSTVVALEKGANFITVSTVDDEGASSSLERLVFREEALSEPIEGVSP